MTREENVSILHEIFSQRIEAVDVCEYGIDNGSICDRKIKM